MKSGSSAGARAAAMLAAGLALASGAGCGRRSDRERLPAAPADATGAGGAPATTGARGRVPKPPRPALPPLQPDEVYVYAAGTDTSATKKTVADARAAGLLVVDLGDGWAPFIFQDGNPAGATTAAGVARVAGGPGGSGPGGPTPGSGAGGGAGGADATDDDAPKPNAYRKTFVDLANDRIDADGRRLPKGERNYLEPFGIPPALSVLLARVTEDASPERAACRSAVDVEGLRAWTGTVGYLDRERARRDHNDVLRDAEWLPQEMARREQTLAAAQAAGGAGGAGGPPIADGTSGGVGPGEPPGVSGDDDEPSDAEASASDGAARPRAKAASAPKGKGDRHDKVAPKGKSEGKSQGKSGDKTEAKTDGKSKAKDKTKERISSKGKGKEREQARARAKAPPPPAPPATWPPGDQAAALAALDKDADPKVRARVERLKRGQDRERAVRVAQQLLTCDGHLTARAKAAPGVFDLVTHEALAAWERKNDIFGWGMLGGETQEGLLRDPIDLDYEAFRRVIGERVADAAGIVEDGSNARKGKPITYTDAAGVRQAVPNLIEDFTKALLAAVHVADEGDMIAFLRQHGREGLGTLKVAFAAPPLPPYYPAPAAGSDQRMELSAEIDRGDVWYDFPFNAKGRPIEQPRIHFPHLTLFTHWRGQRIPLCTWRTTIGSWRSEMHTNGHVYYKYKNSDVGKRVWKDIVAGPVWIPPDGTPVKDLLVKKVLERNKRPQTVVNTDVMGPGFQSAYGLVMAIHIDKNGRDNQIRTHGSVDYTSIARRFSHGCHRLVNDRAVRLFDFILRHSEFRRIGSVPLHVKRKFEVDGEKYAYGFSSRGYYYELANPVPVMVTEGRVMGAVKKPILEYVRKEGVDYEGAEEDETVGELEPVADEKGKGKAKGGTGARGRGATLAVRRRSAEPSTGDAAASVKAIGGSRATAIGP